MTAASPQELVEHALRTSTSDQCVVIVRDSTSANLRWANNTLTTNGVMHGVSVTVVAFHGTGEGTAAGSVSASASSTEQVTRIVEQADAAARASGPAEDAAELPTGDAAADWFDPSARDLDRGLLRLRARRSARPSAGPPPRAGSSTASWTTTSPRRTSAPAPGCGCGTSSRPATTAAPPSPPTCRPAPGSAAPPATSPTSTPPRWTPSWSAGSAGPSAGSTSRPAATTRSCRRPRSSDLMIYAYWTAVGPRGARRADGVLQARRRHPDRRAALRQAAAGLLRPGLPAASRPRRSSAPPPATRSRASSTTACRSRAPTGSRTAR